MNTQAHTDYAGAEYNFFMNYDVGRLELDSHEIQFTGGGDRISWLAGAYTWDQTNSNRGLEWSHADWTHAAPAGPQQILDFATCWHHRPATRRRNSAAGISTESCVPTAPIVGPADGDNGLGADPRQLGSAMLAGAPVGAVRPVRSGDQFLDLQ